MELWKHFRDVLTPPKNKSGLRTCYTAEGDGVAHANLDKLIAQTAFKTSAKAIIERNETYRQNNIAGPWPQNLS